VQQRAGGDLAVGGVPTPADQQVVGLDDLVEEVPVQVVEAGPLRRRVALADERAEQHRREAVRLAQRLDLGRRTAVEHDPVAGQDLLEQLPQQHRHAEHVHQAQHRVVVRPRDPVALTGGDLQRRVLAGVEQRQCADRLADPVEQLDVLERDVAVRLRIRRDIADPEGAAVGQADTAGSRQAVPHGRGRVVAR
jgi:hypothetical protein